MIQISIHLHLCVTFSLNQNMCGVFLQIIYTSMMCKNTGLVYMTNHLGMHT